MIRTLTMAAALASALSLPALAQTTLVPQPDAGATMSAPIAPQPDTGAAITSPTAPQYGADTGMTAPGNGAVELTAEQEKGWVNKPVYSSDGKSIGEVVAFARGTDDKISELHIDIGGFLGLGQTRVKLTPEQFKLDGDRVTADVTADAANDLPRVE